MSRQCSRNSYGTWPLEVEFQIAIPHMKYIRSAMGQAMKRDREHVGT